MRHEYPHSLSYQASTLTMLFAITIVARPSMMGLRRDESRLRLDRMLPKLRTGHMPAVTYDHRRMHPRLVPIRVFRTGLPRIGIDVASGRPIIELGAISSGSIMWRDVGAGLGGVAANVDYGSMAIAVATALGDCGKERVNK